jgi:hypothetical protein
MAERHAAPSLIDFDDGLLAIKTDLMLAILN